MTKRTFRLSVCSLITGALVGCGGSGGANTAKPAPAGVAAKRDKAQFGRPKDKDKAPNAAPNSGESVQ